MSASSVHKPAKKHKKPKEPPLEVEEQEANLKGEKPRRSKTAKADKKSPSTPAAADVIGSSAEPAMEKKRKEADGEDVSEAVQGVEDSQPEKKKKKRRHEEKEATEQVDALQIEEDDSGQKKKRKRKELVTTEDREQGQQEEGESGNGAVGDHGISVQSSSSKKEKKKKKRKQSEEGEKARPKEKSKKKRKHSSSSGFPNPGEDESLSEQGRKALEYAFAQFEDPDSWKFHKARQNWLLRNIWSDEAVPEKYMSLARRYLQGVQGGARETLIKSCQEALEPSKLAASNAETAEQEIPPKSSEVDDPITKRTVKFTIDEDCNIPSTTDYTKCQRATSLLTALTS
ncbi:hypothetical protein V8D89_010697 [Ganoderma adspersum]